MGETNGISCNNQQRRYSGVCFFDLCKVTSGKKQDTKQRIILSIFFALILLIFFFNPLVKLPALWYVGIITSTIGFISVFLPLVGRHIVEKQKLEASEKRCNGATILINESGLRTKADDESQDLFLSWKSITCVMISDNLYLFPSPSGIVIFFNKCYIKGEEDKLDEYIHQYLGSEKITHRKS